MKVHIQQYFQYSKYQRLNRSCKIQNSILSIVIRVLYFWLRYCLRGRQTRKSIVHSKARCQSVNFCRATPCISTVFAVARCQSVRPSVCPSVCPSVTYVYCIQRAKDIVKLLSRPITLALLIIPRGTTGVAVYLGNGMRKTHSC